MTSLPFSPEEKKFLIDCIAARREAMGELIADAAPGEESRRALGNWDMATDLHLKLHAGYAADLRMMRSAG